MAAIVRPIAASTSNPVLAWLQELNDARILWPRVSSLEVYRSVGGRGEPEAVAVIDISHVDGQDDRLDDLGSAYREAEKDAKMRDGRFKYTVIVKGSVPQARPAKLPKGYVAPPDLKGQPLATLYCHCGEREEPKRSEGSSDAALKLVEKVIDNRESHYDGVIRDIEGAFKLHATMTAGIGSLYARVVEDNARLRADLDSRTEAVFKLEELKINDATQQRKEAREDSEAEATRAHEESLAKLRYEQNGKIIEKFGGLASMVVRVALRQWEAKHTPKPNDAPADDSLVKEVAAFVHGLKQEQVDGVRRLVGDEIWGKIVAASRAANNEEAKARMHEIKPLLLSNPMGVIGLFTEATEVLGEDAAEALLDILQRAGVVDFAADAGKQDEKTAQA